jgi:hypothetical protein
VSRPPSAPRAHAAWGPTLLCLFIATGAAAQGALKVEPQTAQRAVRATVTNPSGSACGAKLGFGDGREERFRIEGREIRVFDHVYAADGSYAARLEGELYVRGLRTVGPCSLDETVQVKVASPPPPPPPPPAAEPAGQGVLGLPLNLPGLQNLPGLSGLPIALPGLTAPAPAPAPAAAPAQAAAPTPVMPAPPPPPPAAPARAPVAAPAPASVPMPVPVPVPAAAPMQAPAIAPAAVPLAPVQVPVAAVPALPPGAGDDILIWRRASSPVLEFVTATDGRQRLVSGESLRWAGFDACWLGLPALGPVYGGDAVQDVALAMLQARLSALVGGRPVAARYVDCAVGGSLQGHADVLLVQREALPLVRDKLPGFGAFEPLGELTHTALVREVAEMLEAQRRRAQALAPLLAAEQAREDQRRRQSLARQFPYTAVLRCAGPAGTVPTATCLSGRTLRSQLELVNGDTTRLYPAADLAQAGTETPQGLVILLRDRFTFETQNVDERLTLTLRITETATDTPIYERSAGRFEVLRAAR